jgi:hypothetical protein
VSLNKLHVRNLCFMRVVVHCHVLKSPSLNPLLNEFNPCEISGSHGGKYEGDRFWASALYSLQIVIFGYVHAT